MEINTAVTQNGNSNVQKSEPDMFNAKNIVKILEDLMVKVTEKEVTPATVNAACGCAGRVVDVLRLHLDAERLKLQMQKRGLA